ncbi:hypothetical protein [Paenibacillus naphthalenovorans]
MCSNRLAFIRSLRKHALLRIYDEMDDEAAEQFDRKLYETKSRALDKV